MICNHLRKLYLKKPVVNDLSFSVKEGEVFALLGSNGAGKTTTIKMILNLIPADGGTVETTEGVRIGYSPETPYFHPFLTGREVLEFYGGLQNISKKELDEPTAGLDALGRIEMMQTIQELKEEGKTIMINSHILNEISRTAS